MKRYLILAALASIHANIFAQPPAPGSSHVVASGDFAVVSFQSGMITGSLFVSQCGTNKQPQTCLNYFIALAPIPPPPPPPGGPPPPPPPPPVPLEIGDGVIPGSDFTGSFGKGTLTLHTDTSAASNPSFNRVVGSGGPISIEFVRTNDMSQHSAGANDLTFASGMKIHSVGESSSSSASASGNVILWSIPSAGAPPPSFVFANVGEHHQVQITIQH